MRAVQIEDGSRKRLESPESMKLSSDWTAHLGPMKGVSIDQEATMRRIGHGRQLDARTSITLYLQSKIVCQGGGEDQRSTLDREDQRRPLQTRDLVGIYRAKRRELCSFHCRQSHHQHRLGLMERGRIIELEVQLVPFWDRQGGDVLVRGGVKSPHNSGEVDHSTHVRAIVTAPGQPCVADLSDQIGRRPGSKSGDHGLTMAIIEHQLVAMLSQARGLLFDRLLKT